jgi:hypothetical protein
MQTGRQVLHDPSVGAHTTAVITGATAVFTKDLCRDMFAVQQLTGDTDVPGIARACAHRLMKSEKCRELEKIVTAVLESPDGMPELENSALLAEVLQVYSEAARAERAGESQQFRKDLLVPALVQCAMDEATPGDPTAFISSINAYESEWDSFGPTTPFQHIVCQAISSMSI